MREQRLRDGTSLCAQHLPEHIALLLLLLLLFLVPDCSCALLLGIPRTRVFSLIQPE